MKEVIGSVATWRGGFGLHTQKWWSKETTKNKRRMISEEIHDFEESKRLAIAVAQPKQGVGTRWESTKAPWVSGNDASAPKPCLNPGSSSDEDFTGSKTAS